MEKVAAALACLLLTAFCPAGHAEPGTLLYREVPEIRFTAAGTLPGHSLGELGLKYRKLVLFAPGPDDPRLKRQLALLGTPEARVGMRERDMVLIPILAAGQAAIPPADAGVEGAGAARAEQDFGVEPASFAALLVGRTDVLKAWSARPFDPAFLFELIDSLPMRRREIQAARGKSPPEDDFQVARRPPAP